MKTFLKILWAGFALAVILVAFKARSPSPPRSPAARATPARAVMGPDTVNAAHPVTDAAQPRRETPRPAPPEPTPGRMAPSRTDEPATTPVPVERPTEQALVPVERPGAAAPRDVRPPRGTATPSRAEPPETAGRETTPAARPRRSPAASGNAITGDRTVSPVTEPSRTARDTERTAAEPSVRIDPSIEGPGQVSGIEGDQGEPEPDGSDSDPPYLYSLAIEPPTVVDGAVATLLAEVVDDISGVKSVMGAIASPSGKSMQTFYCREGAKPGLFAGSIKIPDDAEAGPWTISTLSVKDKANNLYTYVQGKDPELGGITLEVQSSGSDATPPELTGIRVSGSPVKDGDAVTLTLEARDDYAGVKSIWGSYRSPSGTATQGFTGRPTEDPGIFTAVVKIPKNAENGQWRAKFVQLTDEAGNRSSYSENDPILVDAVIVVTSLDSDSIPPTLVSISLNPRTVRQNETVTVTVQVEDDQSGPKSVLGWARNPARTARLIFTCTQQANGSLFEGSIIVPENAQVGEWYVDTVHLYDNAGNLRHYVSLKDPELDGVTFTVEEARQ